jgi:hypothetical protein
VDRVARDPSQAAFATSHSRRPPPVHPLRQVLDVSGSGARNPLARRRSKPGPSPGRLGRWDSRGLALHPRLERTRGTGASFGSRVHRLP